MRVGFSPPDPYLRTDQTVAGDATFNEHYAYAGRTQVFPSLVPGQHTTLIITFGDSLSSATDNSAYSPTNATMVQDISIDNGGVYQAATPALGTSNEVAASVSGFWGHRLADKLINAGNTQRVIHGNLGIGSTGTALWATPQFSWRFGVLYRRLNALGLLSASRIFILSSIGGLDQYQALGTATVQANLATIIAAIRAAGFATTPLYLALSSWGGGGLGGVNGTNVRAAILNTIAGTSNTFRGADTDTIAASGRYDTNHYNATGSDAAATLWYNTISGIFP